MSQDALVQILEETRSLLSDPGNDFGSSRWRSAPEAASEIDAVLSAIHAGGTVKLFDLEMLFAPTASLQEVSIASGWSDEFLDLSTRFDDAIRDL